MQEQIEQNLQRISTWKRIFFMLVFAVIAGMVRLLIWAVIILQLGSVLITGEVNKNVLSFGRSLAAYMYHMHLFLTFNTDDMAFPFASWSLYKEPENLSPQRRD